MVLVYVKKHDIHIKPKFYKLELVGELVLYEFLGSNTLLTNLNIQSLFVDLKVHIGL